MLRIPQFLADSDVRFEMTVHPPAFTAQRRAGVLKVPGEQLAKSVLLAGRNRYAVAVLPATHRIDLDALCPVFGERPRLATLEEVAEHFRDCEWGAVMPFGRLYGVTTVLDDAFAPESPLLFASHLYAMTIRMRCRDFEALERPRRMAFAVRRAQPPPARSSHW